jgi:inosose dehydratase
VSQFAFSKPTSSEEDTNLLFSRFREIGYDGLQLKGKQYMPYVDDPLRFLDEWHVFPGAASALIAGGKLDEAGLARIRKAMAFGRMAGTEIIVLCHGVAREGLSADDIRGFARDISELGKEFRDNGIRLSLHNHFNQPVMHREDIAVFFDAVDDEAVGLTVDTAHLVKSGVDDVAGVIREFGNVIDNFHLKDIDDGRFKELGTGSIDFTPIFAAIRDIGYDGWISTDEESDADLIGAMEGSLRFMKDGLGR